MKNNNNNKIIKPIEVNDELHKELNGNLTGKTVYLSKEESDRFPIVYLRMEEEEVVETTEENSQFEFIDGKGSIESFQKMYEDCFTESFIKSLKDRDESEMKLNFNQENGFVFIEKAGNPNPTYVKLKQSSFNVKVDEETLKEFKQVVKNNGGKIGFETTVALENYIKERKKSNNNTKVDKDVDSFKQISETLYNHLENDIGDRITINEITRDLETFKDFVNSDKCSVETLLYSQSLVHVNSFDNSKPNFYRLEVSLTIIHNVFRKAD